MVNEQAAAKQVMELNEEIQASGKVCAGLQDTARQLARDLGVLSAENSALRTAIDGHQVKLPI
jgi:hypothetical protein